VLLQILLHAAPTDNYGRSGIAAAAWSATVLSTTTIIARSSLARQFMSTDFATTQ
jgi:hypothetical protein